MFRVLFSRRWLLATILVLFATAAMTRLGMWQIDRLVQRRAFNARVSSQLAQPTLNLNSYSLNDNLVAMEYREINVSGQYDFEQEIIIRNQVWDGQAGVHLLTPLKITGLAQSIFVDRGWIPLDKYKNNLWADYDERGEVHVSGQIRLSQEEPTFGGRPDIIPARGESMKVWNFVNIEAISMQIAYSVLPIYIQQSPNEAWTKLPYRSQPDLDLTEGPHLGYAGQWFLFATILLIGYPIFVRQEGKQTIIEH
jgi:surfeit locus 1 family protein